MNNPKVCILKADGINCEMEMGYAFEVAGATSEIIHVNELRTGKDRLSDYGVLALPGGFSYGDDIASGKVLANELISSLADDLQEFVAQGKPVLGVCNGFQVLVRTGLLPNGVAGEQSLTLSDNKIGRFVCRWSDLAIGSSLCKFAKPADFAHEAIPMQVAHGEGRLVGNEETIRRLMRLGQIVFRYDPEDYPNNPSGSTESIAGICDPSGLILGIMPHPERSIAAFHPHRARTGIARDSALTIFRNIVNYAKGC